MIMKLFFDRDYPTLTLVPKKPIASECDGSVLRPSVMESMTREEIHQMPIVYDDRTVRLDELFDVIGDPCPICDWRGLFPDRKLRFSARSRDHPSDRECRPGNRHPDAWGTRGDCGDCGEDLATNMRQGTVVVHGSAGIGSQGP